MDPIEIRKSWADERKQTWVDLFARLSTYTDPTAVPVSEIERVVGKTGEENAQVFVPSRKHGFRKSAPRRRSIKMAVKSDKDVSDIGTVSDDSSRSSLREEFDSSYYDSESVDSVQYVLHCNEQRKLPGFNAKVENCQTYLQQSIEREEDICAQRSFLRNYEPSLSTTSRQLKSGLHSKRNLTASDNLNSSSHLCSQTQSDASPINKSQSQEKSIPVESEKLATAEQQVCNNRVSDEITLAETKENSAKSPILTAPSNNVNSDCEIFDTRKHKPMNERSDDKENRSPLENCSVMKPNGQKKPRKKVGMKTFSSEVDSWDSQFSLDSLNSKSLVSSTVRKKMLISLKPYVDKGVEAADEEITGLFSDADSTVRNEEAVSGGAKSNKLRLSADNEDLVSTMCAVGTTGFGNQKKFNASLLPGIAGEIETLIVNDERKSCRTLPGEQPKKSMASSKNQKSKLRETTDRSPTVSVALDPTSPTKRDKLARCRQRLFTSFSENDGEEAKGPGKGLAGAKTAGNDDLLNANKEGSENSERPDTAHLLTEHIGGENKKRKLEDSSCGPVKQSKKKRERTDAKHVPANKSLTLEHILPLEPIQKEYGAKNALKRIVKSDGVSEHVEVQNTMLHDSEKQPELALNTARDGSPKRTTENRTTQVTDKRERSRRKKQMRFQRFTSEDHTLGLVNRRISTIQNRIPLGLEHFLNDEE